jgi:hypothetical protein
MPDREQVIHDLEQCLDDSVAAVVPADTVREVIALLKAQEPIEARLNLCESCTKEYAECEADKTDLVYGSGVGNDNIIGCPWYVNRWKAQEPVEPKVIDTSSSKLYHNDMFKNHYCGNCGEFLHVVNRKDLFCSQCGRAVKWE